MRKKTPLDNIPCADIAGKRAKFYETFVNILERLPDKIFLEQIQGSYFNRFIDSFDNMGSPGFKNGVRYIRNYQSHALSGQIEEILQELSVDRTRIFRGTGPKELAPPYEGLYTKRDEYNECLIAIKRFYRMAGIMPEDSVNESPDYVCIELDFMKMLCLREQEMASNSPGRRDTILNENSFLHEHLGQWIGEFCDLVEKHALTDLYRGVALLLKDFISHEMVFLNEAVSK